MDAAGSMGVVGCLIEMRLDADAADDAVRLVRAVVERTEAKHGCHACSVSRDVADPLLLIYSELWTSETVFRDHVRSQEFRHVLAAMDMCREEPHVTIGALSGRPGLEHLRQLCKGPVPPTGPA
jgi:quinol monooxygenase YgiN